MGRQDTSQWLQMQLREYLLDIVELRYNVQQATIFKTFASFIGGLCCDFVFCHNCIIVFRSANKVITPFYVIEKLPSNCDVIARVRNCEEEVWSEPAKYRTNEGRIDKVTKRIYYT